MMSWPTTLHDTGLSQVIPTDMIVIWLVFPSDVLRYLFGICPVSTEQIPDNDRGSIEGTTREEGRKKDLQRL